MPRPVGEQVVVVTGAPRAPYVTSKFAPRGCYDTPRMKQAGRHPAVKAITILPASIDTPIVEHARTKLERMPMVPNPDTADHPGHTASQRLESSQKLRNVKQRSYFTELAWQQPLVKRALTAGIAAALAPRVLR